MIEAVILSMIVAKIKKYKLKPLFKSWHIYPILAFAFIYICLQILIFMGNYHYVEYGRLLEKVYIFLFLIVIFKYRIYTSAIIGSMFVFAGTVLNKIAISANGGRMPVFPTLSYLTGYVKDSALINSDSIHILGDSETNLKFLTDVIDIGCSVMSIGDILIRVFAFIVIYSAVKSVNEMETAH